MHGTSTAADLAPLAARYRALLEVGHSLSSPMEGEEDLYAAVYRETARVMEVDGFYISLYEDTEDLATVVFWAEQGRGRFARIPYPGSESVVIQTGRASLIRDSLESRSLLVLGDAGSRLTRSAVTAPLRTGDRVVGAISAQSYQAEAYSQAELELLQGIADVAALAMENVRHLQELDRRRREAERMEEIGRLLASSLDSELVLTRVVETGSDLLSAEGVVVWLREGTTIQVAAARGRAAPHVGTEITLEARRIRKAMDDGTPRTIPPSQWAQELPPGLEFPAARGPVLVVPLQGEDQVLGAISVTLGEGRTFSPEDTHLLQRLAGHAAVALENARLHSTLQTLSLTDALTQLPNRRQLDVHLQREFAAAHRGRPLSVVLFDVDRFKEYNDTQGHVAGDRALQAVAQVLSDETRAMNLVARYGGDEFLAVLSDTDLAGAELHAQRIHRRVARDPELRTTGLTLSSGVASFSPEMKRIEDLIRAADEDMYEAKRLARSSR